MRVRYEDRSLDVTFDDDTSEGEIIRVVGKEMVLALEVGDIGAVKLGAPAGTCPM